MVEGKKIDIKATYSKRHLSIPLRIDSKLKSILKNREK
jgi:hypothetical protein